MQATALTRVSGVLSELAGERALLVDAAGAELITLNPAGTILWEVLAEPSTSSELADALARRFPDQPRAVLERDVADFVIELRSAGLIDAAD